MIHYLHVLRPGKPHGVSPSSRAEGELEKGEPEIPFACGGPRMLPVPTCPFTQCLVLQVAGSSDVPCLIASGSGVAMAAPGLSLTPVLCSSVQSLTFLL